MKSGANRTDQNSITRLHNNGESVEEISHHLQIDEAVVKSFIPTTKESASKSKSKLADKFDK